MARTNSVVFIEEPVFDESAAPYFERTNPEPNVMVCRPHTPVNAPGFDERQLPHLRRLVQQMLQEEVSDNYIAWLQGLARGSQGIRVIAGYETDAISLGSQLSDGHRLSRMALMRRGIQILQQAGWMVFPDAGGPFWPGYAVILKGLREVGASGFTVDVSGYEDLGECYRYGKRLSAEMGGVPWIIDGSRRRRDPSDKWCNDPMGSLGLPPTFDPAEMGRRLGVSADEVRASNLSGIAWMKKPGESDGDWEAECRGVFSPGERIPPAGEFSPKLLLYLILNSER
jgi:hypothetical protein